MGEKSDFLLRKNSDFSFASDTFIFWVAYTHFIPEENPSLDDLIRLKFTILALKLSNVGDNNYININFWSRDLDYTPTVEKIFANL